MDYQNYIGMPLLDVLRELDEQGISYTIKEHNSIQKKYDIILVTKIAKVDGKLEIVPEKFLLKI